MRRVTVPEDVRGCVDALGLPGAAPYRALLARCRWRRFDAVGALVAAGGLRRSRNCRCRMFGCWPWVGQGGTMSVMATPLAGLPFGRPLTVDDLERMPDDGHRYELLDGTLLVSPAPNVWHQEVALELAVQLRAVCPPRLRVVIAPFEWRRGRRTALQPDVLVARRADLL